MRPFPLLSALAALALLSAPASAQTLLRGRLLDAATAGGVAEGTVVLSANRGRFQTATRTDSAGHFAFADLAPGPYRLRASRIGYREVAGPVSLAGDSLVEVELRMAAGAVVLAPVTVTSRAERPVSPVLRGFYARMSYGPGRFLTREEVEAGHPVRVTDVLRNVPNLRLNAPRGGVGGGQMSQGSTGERCAVVFFVDGMLLSRWSSDASGAAIDDYVHPGEVEGIEIYRGEGDTPAEFVTRWVHCGTVVVWTRRGD